MNATHVIDVDLAEVFDAQEKGEHIITLAWGDPVEVLDDSDPKFIKVKLTDFVETANGSVQPKERDGYIRPSKTIKIDKILRPKDQNRVLKIDFVDVQQGDASVVETPDGKIMLIDGGDNQMFARYLANRLEAHTKESKKAVDCILVTHGDADHFQGLTQIYKSQTHEKVLKRLFIEPARIYHNGLVKAPAKDGSKETDLLGATVKVGKTTYITELHEDLRQVADARMNKPFRDWKEALEAITTPATVFRRLEQGSAGAFDFLGGGVTVDVLGPLTEAVNGGKALPFLHEPPKGPRLGHEALGLNLKGFGGLSASHTINGHSVVLRLNYKNVHCLFSGDLNDEAERTLTQQHIANQINLSAEVFKVPHHGSHDFSAAFLQAVRPVVSVVSSGDESAKKEYIHPRSTLMGALGKYSRTDEPLIFVTELVAFFEVEGYVCPEFHQLDKDDVAVVKNGKAEINKRARKEFFAFSRKAYGITMVRTDGERLFVFTNSGSTRLKEAYAYSVDAAGTATPQMIRKV